jgi:hypothetical protein
MSQDESYTKVQVSKYLPFCALIHIIVFFTVGLIDFLFLNVFRVIFCCLSRLKLYIPNQGGF